MIRIKSTYLAMIAVLLSPMLVNVSQADPIVETGDAGDLMDTAQVVEGGTTSISGTGGGSDIDLYLFGWGGGDFIAAVTTSLFDAQLFLFDSNGFGILADDDSGPGLAPLLSILSLAIGDYFLGINRFNVEPTSVTGNIFANTCCVNQQPTGPGVGDPLSGWTTEFGDVRSYTIDFNAATVSVSVPEPGTLALFGLGLLGLAARRKKKV